MVKILICGVLPPPNFGHSMLYQRLMSSKFPDEFDVKFLNMKYWDYGTDKKVTWRKVAKMFKYYALFIWSLLTFRPKYVLYNISFYKMPWLKDALFCVTSILFSRLVIHDHGRYVNEHPSKLKTWILRHAVASIVLGHEVCKTYKGLMPTSKLFIVPGGV